MPLLDLHTHFPMHTRFPPQVSQGPPPIGKELEFWVANQLLNYQGGKPRVSLDEVMAGAPGGIGSVLYDPDDEFFHDAKPRPEAFLNLLAQMKNVEDEVAGKIKVATNPAQVRQYLAGGQKFLFHCVEGAFAFGGDPGNVDKLAARGVAYVIVAHLFYRGVASCQNALPFVPDPVFETLLNPEQDSKVGLTTLGAQIVERLLVKRVLVDITHANEIAQNQIFQMARDHGNAPVISSHSGVRGTSRFPLNLSAEAVRQIARSGGVIGIILSPYWLRQPEQQVFGADGFQLLFKAIDWIHSITNRYDHIAIGSDLDGFIHPVKGCEDYSKTPALVEAIRHKYPQDAERILWANALDVLERGWQGV
ncbi:MAG TPA: membrane dipeptidase [Bryobacteraceae bacterium]|nr:membrane dipeptidase [Bryobacteraceae bacterium]